MCGCNKPVITPANTQARVPYTVITPAVTRPAVEQVAQVYQPAKPYERPAEPR